MKRHLPRERVLTFVSIAAVTRRGTVCVVCRGREIRRQYRRGVKAAGGNPDNLVFVTIGDEVADRLPQGIVAWEMGR